MCILVIEDEQKVSALIKRGLKSERYAVDVAPDGIVPEKVGSRRGLKKPVAGLSIRYFTRLLRTT